MKKVEIDVQLVEAIAQYLATRPWSEVNGLMVGLHRTVNGELPTPQPAAEPAPAQAKKKAA